FLFSKKGLEAFIVANVKELQEKKKQLEQKKVTSWTSAMLRNHELQVIQERIDYALLGDTVSRAFVQEKLSTIEELETKIAELTNELHERKYELNKYVFG